MISQRKIEANRRNAQSSTGPKSAGGRSRARRNALKTGLYSKTVLLPFEDAKAYARLRVAVLAEYAPQSVVEEGLVELIIADLWRLDRLLRVENALVEQTARSRRHVWGQMPAMPLETFLTKMQPDLSGSHAKDALAVKFCTSSTNNDTEADQTSGDSTVLLDAYVPRISQSPMEDVGRQRRLASRELLRNIAGLHALQTSLAYPHPDPS